MTINEFKLPDPCDIGESEYRAIHQLLEECLEGEGDGAAAARFACAVLWETKEWCDRLISELHKTQGALT